MDLFFRVVGGLHNMLRLRFGLALAVAGLLLGVTGSVVAATATTNTTNESLQQQLQALQATMAAPAPAAAKPAAPAPTNTTLVQLQPPVAATPAAPAAPAPVAANPAATAAMTDNIAAATDNANFDENDLRNQAFGKMVNTALPLSPNQIQMLRSLYDATQRAAVAYPGTPPRPTSTSIAVNLAPGSTPPVIRLSAGFVTSLVFVDSTGAPWPIDSYSLGNPTAFNIQWDRKSNILLVQAITSHRMGNLAVILKGLNTPVMLDLNPGQAAMDARVDLRIPGLGPNATPIFDGLPGTQSPALLALLDGIPPTGAKALKASACDDCVWLSGGKLYLRTPYTVLSPAWISTLSSADGTRVYEMQPTPLILASYNGKTIKIKVEGF